MKKTAIDKLMSLSRREFIKTNLAWMKECNDGKLMKVSSPSECPLALWVAYNNKKCSGQMVANTAACPLCGLPVCPDCMNHVVEQLSRVTGYMSNVGSWNEAKQQEFKDRNRHNI